MEQKISGYIVTRGPVVPERKIKALSRKGRTGHRWVGHKRLHECFVHGEEVLKEARARGEVWAREATHVYRAEYNPATLYAEPTGAMMMFGDFMRQLDDISSGRGTNWQQF